MPEAGDLIAGKYRVQRALKRGGMGAVYVARHVETDREFAVKLMSHELMGDAEAEARFEREARAESAIDHPGIVKVYDIGRHGPYPYMVMELLQGESLGEFLSRGAMPPDDALLIMSKVLQAMHAAHEGGVVHRDLKPDNIYLCAGDGPVRPKILDFGISKLVDQEAQTKLTQTGVALGTPLYMSPEQVRGDRGVDRRTDVYSLGVILYQMVTGRMPYTAESYAELVFKIINGDAPGVRTLNEDLPETLEAVIRCAMARELEQRYPDVRSFGADLDDLVRGARPTIEARLSATTTTQEPTPFATTAEREALKEPKRDPRALYIGGAAAVLALGVGLGALLGGGGGDPGEAEVAPPVMPATPAAAAPGEGTPPEVPAPAPEPEQTPSPAADDPLAAPDAGTAKPSATAPEAEPGRPSQRQNRPRRGDKTDEATGETPVLRLTPREGGDEDAPSGGDIKMVDDEIIDPFQ